MMRQSWLDLAFLHWPLPARALRHLVPPELDIDEFEGSSWIGLVPFRMHGVTPRGLPDLPMISAFTELNLRLYVVRDGKPGVWFLSLDADNSLAVWAARALFHLPYHRARMTLDEDANGIHYRSERQGGERQGGAGESGRVVFRGRYRATSKVYEAAPGSLEHWLTERYCLYARAPSGRLLRADVHHWPWPLQRAEVEIAENTLSLPHGFELDAAPPLVHFARELHVAVWRPVLAAEPHQS